MADLTITPASVKLITGSTERMISGATFTAAQAVYKEASSSKAKLADNDSATAEVRALHGVTLHASLADQPVDVAKNGAVIDVGAILTAGAEYYVSGTPGGIAVRADVTTGDDVIRVGIALTTSRLQLDFADPNVTL